jgi:hypothetical protein
MGIVVILVVIFMGWFAIGMIYNLRRGDAIMKWMQGGLPKVGAKTSFDWLGSSVLRLVIDRAQRPMRSLTVLLVFMPRDVFWMTLWALIQGRRDVLIFRGQASQVPAIDLELAHPKTWTGRTAIQQARQRNWESRPYGDLLLLAPHGLLDLAEETVNRLGDSIKKLSPGYVRFALRRQDPHFELHLPLPDIRSVDAAEYFGALQALVGALGNRQAD